MPLGTAMLILRVIVFLAGAIMVVRTLLSAALTFVVPRGLTIAPPAPWSSDRSIRYMHIRHG